MRIAVLCLLGVVACTPVAPELQEVEITPMFVPPDGWPPVMGDITGKIAGQPVAWQTYDFSIGAFDASAWIAKDYDAPGIGLRLTGHPVGDPDGLGNRVSIFANFPDIPQSGQISENARIEIDNKDVDGPVMTSKGQAVKVTVTQISRSDSAYGSIAGTAQGTICDPSSAACRPVVLDFKTELQFDGV